MSQCLTWRRSWEITERVSDCLRLCDGSALSLFQRWSERRREQTTSRGYYVCDLQFATFSLISLTNSCSLYLFSLIEFLEVFDKFEKLETVENKKKIFFHFFRYFRAIEFFRKIGITSLEFYFLKKLSSKSEIDKTFLIIKFQRLEKIPFSENFELILFFKKF